MANVANISDSYSPLIHEIIFAVDGRQFDIPSHEFLQSISVELTSTGAWSGQIVLFDENGDFLENLILLAGSNRRILFRWGWDDGRGLQNYPLYEGAITFFVPEFTPEGVTLTLEIIASNVLKNVLDKKPQETKEKDRCSDIVRRIADANKWPHTVTVGKSVIDTIEQTKLPLGKVLSAKDESDLKFIRDKVEKEAINKDDKAVRFFFDHNNVMHFHSDLFLVKQDPKRAYAATYRFARDAMGEVIKFAPKDASVFKGLLGGGNADFTAIDSLAGNRLLLKSTQTAGIEGSRIEVIADSAFQTPLPGNNHAKINLIARDPNELRRLAASRHSRLREFSYMADLDVRGTHAVQVLDTIQVYYIKRDGLSHYLSGEFHVHGISHDVSTSGWTTSMSLMRTGTKPPTPIPGGKTPKQKIDREIPGSETAETQGSGIASGRRARAGFTLKKFTGRNGS